MEAALGAVVLIVAGIFLYVLYEHAEETVIDDGYGIVAEFSNAQGLDVGSDVRLAGIKIGTVSSMALNETTYGADVGLYIRSDLRLASDSTFTVASESLLGGYFVEVLPGASEEMLEPSERVFNTQPRMDFLSTLTAIVASSETEPSW